MFKVIELKGIYVKYNKKSDYIFEDLNLNVESGEFIVIIGLSGVGKSIFFKVIVNVFEILKGSVRLFG